MTAVAPVAAIRLPAVMPAAKPGRATRFQPAHKWIRFVCRTTPNAVREPGAVPFIQKPRPGTSENDAASVGIAEDQPTPPAQASQVQASAQAIPAAKSTNAGSVKRRGTPRRLRPEEKAMRTFAAIAFERPRFPAASTD